MRRAFVASLAIWFGSSGVVLATPPLRRVIFEEPVAAMSLPHDRIYFADELETLGQPTTQTRVLASELLWRKQEIREFEERIRLARAGEGFPTKYLDYGTDGVLRPMEVTGIQKPPAGAPNEPLDLEPLDEPRPAFETPGKNAPQTSAPHASPPTGQPTVAQSPVAVGASPPAMAPSGTESATPYARRPHGLRRGGCTTGSCTR